MVFYFDEVVVLVPEKEKTKTILAACQLIEPSKYHEM